MSELDLTNIAVASINTPAAGVTAVFTDNADNKTKNKISDGTVGIFNNDGLQDLNVIFNGGFAIQQRVAPAATNISGVSTTTRAGVVADRWAVTVGNVTTPQWAQIDAITAPESGLTSRYYGKIIQNTNAAKFILSQMLAAQDIAGLRGKKVRLSVKIKQFAGSNANYRLGLLQLSSAGTADSPPTFISAIGAASVEPTWGTNIVAINPDASPTGENGTISGAALTIASTANWVRSSCVFTVPSSCLNLYVVLYRDTLGAASDALGIAEFQLTEGADIVDFVTMPFHYELLKAQRYFAKTFNYTVVPATNVGINSGEAKGIAGKAGAVANAGFIYWRFPITMFKQAPTITIFNPAAANAQIRDITGSVDHSGSTATTQGDNGIMIGSTGNASTAVGDQIGVHLTADAEFIA